MFLRRCTGADGEPHRRKGLCALVLLLGAALALAACGEGDIEALPESAATSGLFYEDFSDNAQGWTLDTEWQIGPATASADDPGTDATATADNGVAGVVLGGDYGTAVHGYYYLTSPVIDAGSISGPLALNFRRWLTTDYPPYLVHIVQVYDGAAWQTVWEQPNDGVTIVDGSWIDFTFDISPHANANLRVRFGHTVGTTGAIARGGWNLDDVSITAP